MARKRSSKKQTPINRPAAPTSRTGWPPSLLDTRIIYCGDCLDQLRKLPDGCVDLIYIDPPFNSNRNDKPFRGGSSEPRAQASGFLALFGDRHTSPAAYIDYMRPRCVELARVLKRTGSFYYHCDWHASHYVKSILVQALAEHAKHSLANAAVSLPYHTGS